VNVEFSKACPSAKLYDPTVGTDPAHVLKDTRTIALELSDHPVVIEIASMK